PSAGSAVSSKKFQLIHSPRKLCNSPAKRSSNSADTPKQPNNSKKFCASEVSVDVPTPSPFPPSAKPPANPEIPSKPSPITNASTPSTAPNPTSSPPPT